MLVKKLLKLWCCSNNKKDDEENEIDPKVYIYLIDHKTSDFISENLLIESRLQSSLIDKEIKSCKKFQKYAIKIVMLGISEAGKSTIVRSIRSIHDNKIEREESQRIFCSIQLLICRSMSIILERMTLCSINFKSNQIELELVSKHFLESFKIDVNYKELILADFWKCIAILWKDTEVKAMANCSFLVKVCFIS